MVFSCPHGPTENMFERLLNFLIVRMEVNENIFEGFSTTNEKNLKKRSVSQMIDLVMTIPTSTGSSKTELSSRGKHPFKVYIIGLQFIGLPSKSLRRRRAPRRAWTKYNYFPYKIIDRLLGSWRAAIFLTQS